MLPVGPAVKVTIHINRDTAAGAGFLQEELLKLLQESDVGIGGATVLHAYAGFGSNRRLHKADEGDVTGLHLPTLLYFIDTPEKVEVILPLLLEMVTDGLVEAHPTQILKSVAGREKVLA
ncbi:MAG: DUF190 domain-containing protein [Edaphobacter sp.]|uniref:DUF190 domain-containing protein n=1 Tax=Edaphobacter sp. TaxID=1934404 RepID=UPI00238E2961|nr:DUF190 domain-containing protein [Edaphobacter sp.]MDE1175206.1 DUF190 domain-containing protein [Edaphobacter sp.]